MQIKQTSHVKQKLSPIQCLIINFWNKAVEHTLCLDKNVSNVSIAQLQMTTISQVLWHITLRAFICLFVYMSAFEALMQEDHFHTSGVSPGDMGQVCIWS